MYCEYHVSKSGSDLNNGSIDSPFLTINKASKVAIMSDTIFVHEGTYREWVKPQNSGMSDSLRITYKPYKNDKVIIKGSEVIDNWIKCEGTVWKKVINNNFFGSFNPYSDNIRGDWMLYPIGKENRTTKVHTGEVYLNGKSLYETYSYQDVLKAEKQEVVEHFFKVTMPYPEDTIYKWYCEVDDVNTTIYANFHSYNPNEELIEINVRKACFYPEVSSINYITVSGFEMAHAACPYTPPTSNQIGLLGVNWAKGWIIENNCIHDAKCSAISIGKEASTGDIECTKYQLYPGYQGQLESVFKALKKGWSKDHVGSHIVRNNKIYNCGQNGIVGHLGCIFSEIYNNEIFEIGTKSEFFGWEIAGIKFHAPIDVQIHNNLIYNCSLGLWLDWQTQGTRVSKNVLLDNLRDVVVEVSNGPYLFDNNIIRDMGLLAQGGAFVNNLIYGSVSKGQVLDRSTPYHFPHSTEVLGCSLVYGNDDRWYNNIFIKENTEEDKNYGTSHYNGCPTSLSEYRDNIIALGSTDIEDFVPLKQPAYIASNIYANGAKAFDKEDNSLLVDDLDFSIYKNEEGVFISLKVTEEMLKHTCKIQGTKTLEMVRIVRALYENNAGDAITIDKDFFNSDRNSNCSAGPFENLKLGLNTIKIW